MKFRNVVDKTLEWVLVFLMSILVLDVLWQVFSRYVLSSPSSYTDELAGYLLIWVGMLGAAYVAGRKEHLAIDLLLQRSSAERRYKLEMIISIIVTIFAVSVLIVGGSWLVSTRLYLSVKSSALSVPLGYVYLVIPISGLLVTYFNIDNMYNMVKANRKK